MANEKKVRTVNDKEKGVDFMAELKMNMAELKMDPGSMTLDLGSRAAVAVHHREGIRENFYSN